LPCPIDGAGVHVDSDRDNCATLQEAVYRAEALGYSQAVSLGYEQIDDAVSGDSVNDGRAYLQWRSSY
jgi:hypothetical protein